MYSLRFRKHFQNRSKVRNIELERLSTSRVIQLVADKNTVDQLSRLSENMGHG